MRFPSIKKARDLYYEGKVYLDKAGEKQAWFDVDGHVVSLTYGEGHLNMACDCKYEANKGVPRRSLCSHLIAAIIYIYGKKGVLKNEKK